MATEAAAATVPGHAGESLAPGGGSNQSNGPVESTSISHTDSNHEQQCPSRPTLDSIPHQQALHTPVGNEADHGSPRSQTEAQGQARAGRTPTPVHSPSLNIPGTAPITTAAQVSNSQSQTQRHACEPCRVAKAKCEPLNSTSSTAGSSGAGSLAMQGSCKRCHKTDRECVFAERTRTRRRKRRESSAGDDSVGGGSASGQADQRRVEELERRIESLAAGVGLVTNGMGMQGMGMVRSGVGGTDTAASRLVADETVSGREKRRSSVTVEQLQQRASRIADVLNSSDGADPPIAKRSRLDSLSGLTSGTPDYGGHFFFPRNSAVTGTANEAECRPSLPLPTQHPSYSSPVSPPNSNQSHPYQAPSQAPYDPVRPNHRSSPTPSVTSSQRRHRQRADAIDQGLLSLSLATLLYNHFTVELLPHVPYVVLPPFFTTSKCRELKPTLFLAILVATVHRVPAASTNGEITPAMKATLVEELHWTIAEKVMFRGEKSLEIAQALLVTASWYVHLPAEGQWAGGTHPMERHKGFMYISQAVSMMLDLGLARTWSAPGKGPYLGPEKTRCSHIGPKNDSEARRTFLGSYWMSVNMCMIFRRPHLLRWSAYLSDSVEVLTNEELVKARGERAVVPTDRILVEMVKGAKVIEEVSSSEMFEGLPNGNNSVGIKAAKIKFVVGAIQKQVEEWWGNVPENIKQHRTSPLP